MGHGGAPRRQPSARIWEASAEAAPRTAATSACKATMVELSAATVAMAESVRFGWRKMKDAGVSVSAMDDQLGVLDTGRPRCREGDVVWPPPLAGLMNDLKRGQQYTPKTYASATHPDNAYLWPPASYSWFIQGARVLLYVRSALMPPCLSVGLEEFFGPSHVCVTHPPFSWRCP